MQKAVIYMAGDAFEERKNSDGSVTLVPAAKPQRDQVIPEDTEIAKMLDSLPDDHEVFKNARRLLTAKRSSDARIRLIAWLLLSKDATPKSSKKTNEKERPLENQG